MMACDGCNERRQAISDAWDFGEFFWDTLANILAALIVGLPLVAWLFAKVGHRGSVAA
jgi:hypothetical protein